jgi:hypothetical protein
VLLLAGVLQPLHVLPLLLLLLHEQINHLDLRRRADYHRDDALEFVVVDHYLAVHLHSNNAYLHHQLRCCQKIYIHPYYSMKKSFLVGSGCVGQSVNALMSEHLPLALRTGSGPASGKYSCTAL